MRKFASSSLLALGVALASLSAGMSIPEAVSGALPGCADGFCTCTHSRQGRAEAAAAHHAGSESADGDHAAFCAVHSACGDFSTCSDDDLVGLAPDSAPYLSEARVAHRVAWAELAVLARASTLVSDRTDGVETPPPRHV